MKYRVIDKRTHKDLTDIPGLQWAITPDGVLCILSLHGTLIEYKDATYVFVKEDNS